MGKKKKKKKKRGPASKAPASKAPASARAADRLEALRRDSAGWGFFAGNFELEDDGPGSALAWFADRAEPAARFRVFGHEGTGGLYAFWLRGGRTPPDAPVVLLGGEGEAKVLASNLDEFLALLAADVDDLGADEGYEPAGSPDHPRYLAWLGEQGLAPAADFASVVAAAQLASPGLKRFVERAMAGEPLVEEPAAGPPTAPTSIPTDPVALLDGPRPKVKLPAKSGLELSVAEGRVKSLFIRPGAIGSWLRPGGLDLLGKGRAEVAAAMSGPPHRSGGSWERWDRGDVAWHVTYGDGAVTMLTLMWRPTLPEHLR